LWQHAFYNRIEYPAGLADSTTANMLFIETRHLFLAR
jgi:hypothetical protein